MSNQCNPKNWSFSEILDLHHIVIHVFHLLTKIVKNGSHFSVSMLGTSQIIAFFIHFIIPAPTSSEPIKSDPFCNPKKWSSGIICRKYPLPNYLRSLLTHIYVHNYNWWAIIRVTTIQLRAINVTLKIDHFDKISSRTQLAWIVSPQKCKIAFNSWKPWD